jgi:CRISPR-associated endoribonuclease Cas6
MDLLSLTLTLKPLDLEPDRELPTWWGRAAHALLLDIVRKYDTHLASALHDPTSIQNSQSNIQNSTPRPFTTSTLMGRFPNRQFDKQGGYTMRLTSIQEELTTVLLEANQNGPLAPGETIELDHLPFLIEETQPPFQTQDTQSAIQNSQSKITTSPWAASALYQELGADYLLARQPPPRRLSFVLTSPTTFKSGGKQVPIPLPDLFFGSLLEKWNAYAPIAFPLEVRRYAAECLGIGRYKLSSRAVPIKEGGVRAGAVGEISYASLSYDRYWMSVLTTLAAFALFSGVGASTSMGLGQCRQI